jgi:hypothetical protein
MVDNFIPSRCEVDGAINVCICSRCNTYMPCHIIKGKPICVYCSGLIKNSNE